MAGTIYSGVLAEECSRFPGDASVSAYHRGSDHDAEDGQGLRVPQRVLDDQECDRVHPANDQGNDCELLVFLSWFFPLPCRR